MRQMFAFVVIMLAAAVVDAAQPAAPAPEATIRGTVTAVTGSRITLLKGLVIDVSGAKITKKNLPAPDALVAGSRVRVTISGSKSSGVLVGESVIVESPDATITGTVDAVSGSSITIAGQPLTLAADATYGGFAAGVVVRGVGDLKSGMPVVADLAATTGGLTATRIVAVGPPPPPPPLPEAAQTSFTGGVTAVGATAWTIGTKTVYVSPKTMISGAPAVGDTVLVRGIRTPEGAVIAAAIAKQ